MLRARLVCARSANGRQRHASEYSLRFHAHEIVSTKAKLAENLFGVFTAARRGARDATRRAFELHRLAHQSLWPEALGYDILHHMQMLDLRLCKYFLQIIDAAAGNAVGVEAFDPVCTVFTGQVLIDRGIERIAIQRAG